MKLRLVMRHWASFHDRLSGAWRKGEPPQPMFSVTTPIETDALAQKLGLTGEWLDHLTGYILPDGVERYVMPWALLPDWMHWVEFGSVEPTGIFKPDEV